MSQFIPKFPAALALGLWFAPLTPARFAAAAFMASFARRRPRLFQRLGAHATKTVLIDPTDLPIVFALTPDPRRPRLGIERRGFAVKHDARIAGPLAALIGLVHGVYDGDALFFSRDLVIEGDIEAVLALRNAIDNEEIDLAEEAAGMFGPLAMFVAPALREASSVLSRLTRVALRRADFSAGAP